MLADIIPLLLVYLLYLPQYAALAVPLLAFTWYLGKGKVEWFRFEYLFALIPWTYWIIMAYATNKFDRSLTDMNQTFLLGIAGGLILVPRLYLRAKTPHDKIILDIISAMVACMATMVILAIMPHRRLY